jgi:Tfp pilus assembly protein PilF
VLGRTGIACVVVALALVASAHGDSLSSYKKQVAGGPAAQAIGMAIDALEAGDLKRAEVASLKALTLAPDEPHALALLAEVEMRQGHQANALKYLQTAVAKNPKSAVAQEAMGRYLDENKEYAGIGVQKGDGAGPQVGGGWETSIIWRGTNLRPH